MKKNLLIIAILLAQFMATKAQWVTIPDANFVTKLQQLFPNCMNGNLMDTSCIQITNAPNLSINSCGISDLTGLEYFISLDSLNCSNNQLTSLPALPSSLTILNCYFNQLSSLPSLPNSLTELYCNFNQLDSLPALPNALSILNCASNYPLGNLPSLPSGLTELYCNNDNLNSLPNLPNALTILHCYQNFPLVNLPSLPNSLIELRITSNQLSSLPTLPNTLKFLYCGGNPLGSLPNLPTTLTILACNANQLDSLPALPSSLKILECSNNLLSGLPVLPNSLNELWCYNNQLTSLPDLPDSLTILGCNDNQLISLPNFPISLKSLYCGNNLLDSLPTLSDSLTILSCEANQLSSIPSIPNSLNQLWCYNNQLTSLPILPNSLTTLDCSFNQLNSLPTLPIFLNQLWCYDNQLTSLSLLPDTMEAFKIYNNNISCLMNLPYVLLSSNASMFNNPLTCVPNQTNYSGSLPFCVGNDLINNPNNCPGINISGIVYNDLDGNCTNNPNDLIAENIPVKLYDMQNNFLAQSFTINGFYSFITYTSGTYLVKIDTLNMPLTMTCGQNGTQSVTLNYATQTIQNLNFSLECSGTQDFWTNAVTRQGLVFPGQMHNIKTNVTNNSNWLNLQCDSVTYPGNVSIQVTGPVTYVAPANNALTPTVNGNTFTYNITDFSTLTPASFGLKFLTDTTAQANDQICVHVEINPTPLDADTTNNVYDFCYQVVNSYDPNMKEVYPVNVLPGYDDWFTYTIHFQNTGNAPAFNIRLRDTLDANLDINSFEILGYSHPAIVSINGNILTVRFNNIMLTDSTTDYEGSMGYFQYRIKPLPNLSLGTQIENTAYIYFDYNAPIVTNTTQNNFQTVVSTINQNNDVNQLKVFPNPANEILNINLQNTNIENCIILNTLGQTVYNSGNEINAKNKIQLNIANLSVGVYFVHVSSSSGSFNAKFVKSE